MTVGYGGLVELPLRVVWAKGFQQSRSHAGKFHAWGGFGALCGRLSDMRPTKHTRDYQPVKACQDCVEKVAAGATQ